MLNDKARRRFDEIKRRAEQRRRELPSLKSDKDAAIENRNARDLMPYVYKLMKGDN